MFNLDCSTSVDSRITSKEIYSLEEYYDSLYEILHILSKFELDISNFLDDYKDHKEIPQIKK